MPHLSSTNDRISVLTERELGTSLSEIPYALRTDLPKRVAALVQEEVQRERDRCAQICRQRSELWHRTLAATAVPRLGSGTAAPSPRRAPGRR